MTAPRGPQRSEDRSDLTPAEARAEVEAFLGEGWRVECSFSFACPSEPYVYAHRGPGVSIHLHGTGPTYRAAVSALKQAWRDAVRPWVRSAYSCGWSAANGGCDRNMIEVDVPKMLKEDDK